MADVKRGRERKGRVKRAQQRRAEIRDELRLLDGEFEDSEPEIYDD